MDKLRKSIHEEEGIIMKKKVSEMTLEECLEELEGFEETTGARLFEIFKVLQTEEGLKRLQTDKDLRKKLFRLAGMLEDLKTASFNVEDAALEKLEELMKKREELEEKGKKGQAKC